MGVLEQLSEVIYQAGFGKFAVMPAKSLAGLGPILKAAQKEGRYSSFAHPEIEKRINPRALQGSAQTVICLATPYFTGNPGPTPTLHGTISRSAWGLDYHRILTNRMERIVRYLQTKLGAQECTMAVDTSFLVDRALAIESGLGYLGSNCSVYVPPFGSWVFLSEILVDLALPSTQLRDFDQPFDHQTAPLDCQVAIKACPTGALLAPGKIQPQRCLSYLTQMTGPIPEEFRSKLGTRLWGCDTCQQACPTNREVQPIQDQDFMPLIGHHIPLLPLLEMGKREFQETFGQTSMAWRGKNTLQRNACLVLGNQGNPEALPNLKQTAKKHPSVTVRDAAEWAIDAINQN